MSDLPAVGWSAAPSELLTWHWHGQATMRPDNYGLAYVDPDTSATVGETPSASTDSRFSDIQWRPDAPQRGIHAPDSWGVVYDLGVKQTYNPYICPPLFSATLATVEQVDPEIRTDTANNGLPVIVSDETLATSVRWSVQPVPQVSSGDIFLGRGKRMRTEFAYSSAANFAYSDAWRMPWSYADSYIPGDDDGEQWEPRNAHHGIIRISQPLEVWSTDESVMWADVNILVPLVDASASFCRHPAEPWRVVPAWNPLYGCDRMTTIKPSNGCIFFDSAMIPGILDHLGRIVGTASDMAEANTDPTGTLPGVVYDSEGGTLDIYAPLKYIAHNGHPAAGDGADGGVVAFVNAITGGGNAALFDAGDYQLDLYAYPARVGFRQTVSATHPPPGVSAIWAIADPGDTAGKDLDWASIDFFVFDSAENPLDSIDLTTVDFDPTDTPSDVIDSIVSAISSISGITATRLADFFEGSDTRFHIEVAISPSYENYGDLDSIAMDYGVEWDDGAVSMFGSLNATPTAPPPTPGPYTGWAIVADLSDTPHVFDHPLAAANGSVVTAFGDSISTPTIVFQRSVSGLSDQGDELDGYLGGPDGYNDYIGWPDPSPFLVDGEYACANIGQLPPGCWVMVVRIRLAVAHLEDAATPLRELLQVGQDLYRSVLMPHFWIDQRPRNCPWAMVNDADSITPGSLPPLD